MLQAGLIDQQLAQRWKRPSVRDFCLTFDSIRVSWRQKVSQSVEV